MLGFLNRWIWAYFAGFLKISEFCCISRVFISYPIFRLFQWILRNQWFWSHFASFFKSLIFVSFCRHFSNIRFCPYLAVFVKWGNFTSFCNTFLYHRLGIVFFFLLKPAFLLYFAPLSVVRDCYRFGFEICSLFKRVHSSWEFVLFRYSIFKENVIFPNFDKVIFVVFKMFVGI